MRTRTHDRSPHGPALLSLAAGLAALAIPALHASGQPSLDPRLRVEFELVLDFDSPTPLGGEWFAFRTPGVQGDQVFFEARSRIPNPDDPRGIPQGWLGFYRYAISTGELTTIAEKNSPLPDGSGDAFVGGGAPNDVGYGLDAGRVVEHAVFNREGLDGDTLAFRVMFTNDESAVMLARVLCRADLAGDPGGGPDGLLDATDFFAYLDLFASGDRDADLAGAPDGGPDGLIDATDFFAYLDLFASGCP